MRWDTQTKRFKKNNRPVGVPTYSLAHFDMQAYRSPIALTLTRVQ